MIDYEIKCYNRFSWGYVYFVDGKRNELWADSSASLKRKVLNKNLPWDDSKVPEAKAIRKTNFIELDRSPASFRLPWCRSNYKRY